MQGQGKVPEAGPAALTIEHWGAVTQALSIEIARVRSLELPETDRGLRLLEEAYAALAVERERRLEAVTRDFAEGEVLFSMQHPHAGYVHGAATPELRLVAQRVGSPAEAVVVEVEDAGLAHRIEVGFSLSDDEDVRELAAALRRWLARPGAKPPRPEVG